MLCQRTYVQSHVNLTHLFNVSFLILVVLVVAFNSITESLRDKHYTSAGTQDDDFFPLVSRHKLKSVYKSE